MKVLKEIFKKINPVEVIKVLKGSDKRTAVKGVLKMGGSGALIPAGAGLIIDGANNESWFEIVGGSILLLIGTYLAVSLAHNVEDLQNGKEENND